MYIVFMYLPINLSLYICTCISPSHVQKSQWYLKVVTPGVLNSMSPMEGRGLGRVPRKGDKVPPSINWLVVSTNPFEKYMSQCGNLPNLP